MYSILLDTETTGIPISEDDKIPDYKQTQLYNVARMIQISWILTLGNKVIKTRSFYVKNKDIQILNTDIHGIDEKLCESEGIEIKSILEYLDKDLSESKLFIGYNIDFDLNILKSEIFRLNENSELIQKLDKISKFDVLNLCCLKFGKFLKLGVLYQNLFDKKFEGAHNSLNDVYATFLCFLKLVF